VFLSQDGPLETCKEHIVCLEDIRNALSAKTGPETDLEEVQEITGIYLFLYLKKLKHHYCCSEMY